MSWLFSRALIQDYENSHSSPEPVEEFLEENSSGGEQFAQLNVMPTQHKFWRNDKTMEFSTLSRFGLTCKLLMEIRGEELLTWYLEGFRVRTLAQRGEAQALTGSEADSGRKWHGSFARYNRATRSWKTPQCSLLEGLDEFSETWPRWGSMRNGECFHAEMSAEFIFGNDARLSLPTTGANEWKGAGKDRYLGSKDFRGAKMSEGLRTCATDPIYLNPLFAELVMMWPLGWTDLKPLGMDKFQLWQQQHSGCLQEGKAIEDTTTEEQEE